MNIWFLPLFGIRFISSFLYFFYTQTVLFSVTDELTIWSLEKKTEILTWNWLILLRSLSTSLRGLAEVSSSPEFSVEYNTTLFVLQTATGLVKNQIKLSHKAHELTHLFTCSATNLKEKCSFISHKCYQESIWECFRLRTFSRDCWSCESHSGVTVTHWMIRLRVSESNTFPLSRSLDIWCDINWAWSVLTGKVRGCTKPQRCQEGNSR